jgi:hypothetical protein
VSDGKVGDQQLAGDDPGCLMLFQFMQGSFSS